jgi:hypothetical protein
MISYTTKYLSINCPSPLQAYKLLLITEQQRRQELHIPERLKLGYTHDKTIILSSKVCPVMQNTYLNETLFKVKLRHEYIFQTQVKYYYN